MHFGFLNFRSAAIAKGSACGGFPNRLVSIQSRTLTSSCSCKANGFLSATATCSYNLASSAESCPTRYPTPHFFSVFHFLFSYSVLSGTLKHALSAIVFQSRPNLKTASISFNTSARDHESLRPVELRVVAVRTGLEGVRACIDAVLLVVVHDIVILVLE